MSDKLNILVLCTGNSARSIIAEALFNTSGAQYFQAWSAGSHPTGKVNPYALKKLAELDYQGSVSSQSWSEYAREDAPHFDIVMTVCGNAAAENCPVFPGNWQHVHWGLPDPAACMDSPEQAQSAFDSCFEVLKSRVERLVSELQTIANDVSQLRLQPSRINELMLNLA
jgi:arsenate reductase